MLSIIQNKQFVTLFLAVTLCVCSTSHAQDYPDDVYQSPPSTRSKKPQQSSSAYSVDANELNSLLKSETEATPAQHKKWKDRLKHHLNSLDAYDAILGEEVPTSFLSSVINALNSKHAFDLIIRNKIPSNFISITLQKLNPEHALQLLKSVTLETKHYSILFGRALDAFTPEYIYKQIHDNAVPRQYLRRSLQKLNSADARVLVESNKIPDEHLQTALEVLNSEDALLLIESNRLLQKHNFMLFSRLNSIEAYKVITTDSVPRGAIKIIISRLDSAHARALIAADILPHPYMNMLVDRLSAFDAWRLANTDTVPQAYRDKISGKMGYYKYLPSFLAGII